MEASSENPHRPTKASRSRSPRWHSRAYNLCDRTDCGHPWNYSVWRALLEFQGDGVERRRRRRIVGKWCLRHFLEWVQVMAHDPLVDAVYSMTHAVESAQTGEASS